MSTYTQLHQQLKNKQYTWLITGVAGFIGSNLLEALLKLNQKVVGLDNFSTGYQKNLDEVCSLVSKDQWKLFHFIEGDIRNLSDCQKACEGVDYVLHEAALGSVPRSIVDPIATNEVNISGFLNMLVASRNAKIKRLVYAASSSTYGDHPDLPKVEEKIGRPLSPYAVTKLVNELYAEVFSRDYEVSIVGLRYFNVFGKRQDANGSYAAVIPKWIESMLSDLPVYINGDGETSRDFSFVENVIQANLLAALSKNNIIKNPIFNVAAGQNTSLNQLFELIRFTLTQNNFNYLKSPVYKEFRAGDVRHSHADINKARNILGYNVSHGVKEGLDITVEWYLKNGEVEGLNVNRK